jgi:DNA-binding ferritin-like protein (Dps family)
MSWKKMFLNFKKNSKKIWREHFPTKAKMLKKGRNEIRAAIKKYLFKCQNDINKKVSFLCSNLMKNVISVFRQISEQSKIL